MSDKLPSRFDNYYIKFEKYEYTYFITYELARRNSNVMNLLNLQYELLAIYDSFPLSFKQYKANEATKDCLLFAD